MKIEFRNIRKIAMGLLVSGMILTACKTDFLNVDPPNEINSDQIWADGSLGEAFVTNIYNGMGAGGMGDGGTVLASISDEAIWTHGGGGVSTSNDGTINPGATGWTAPWNDWTILYRNIRATNIAIESLAKATFTDQALKERLEGEARFLRAYFHNQLLSFYGGIPIITKVYGLNEDYDVERSTYDECVKFIVQDCDKASMLLDGKNPAKGRATKLAAMALKSRVLTYAASDLHDMPTATAKAPILASISKPELIGYTSGDRKARWQAALDASKAVWDNSGGGYKLNLTAPETPEQARWNYSSVAMGGYSADTRLDASAAGDAIFAKYFNPARSDDARRQGLTNGPNGYHNWAGNAPVGQLVDDYQMMDGTPFSWTNPVHAADPYENREPRFYASILFDGADWKPRDKISGNVDPANQIQTGAYDLLDDSGKLITRKGLDTRQSSIEDWNGTRSGYYIVKFIDPNPNLVDNYDRQNIPFAFFRVTEAVFNYAEASIELGDLATATSLLNKIRFRSGMPAIKATTADDLRTALRQEKRIEMAYEEQRYFDARRWMIAKETLGRPLAYISVEGKFKPEKSMKEPYRKDKTVYSYKYQPITSDYERRTWVDKMYYRPISRDEINKNVKLATQQNPGYDK